MTQIDLVIAIPTAGRVPMPFAYSLAGMIGYIGAHRVKTLPEATISVCMDVIESSNWIENREQCVMRALESGKTHLMFLDDDMAFEPNVLDHLLGRRLPAVVTNYLIKTVECDSFTAVGLNGKRLVTDENSTGLEPCLYSGFGASVFDLRETFAKMPQPWFQLDWNAEAKKYTTEDNPCMRKMREVTQIYCDHDASKLLRHIGQKAWHWTEYKRG